MKRLFLFLVPLVLAACGAAGPASGQTGSTQSASVASISAGSSGLGQIIVAGNGKTLYLFEADQGTTSTCFDACARVWPPLTTAGTPIAAGGASASLIGTSRRSDGTTQVTYAGHPLYFYVSDEKPGDTNGEGSTSFGAGWDVLSPAGAKIEGSGS